MATIYITTFFIFLLATIIGGIYMLIYKRNLNRALRENNPKHASMPDVRSVIIFILVVVLFYGVYSTKNKTEFMYDEMYGEFRAMERDINALRSKMASMTYELQQIKKSNMNVQLFTYDIASYDADKKTVTYNVQMRVKEFNESTKVSLRVDEQLVELMADSLGEYTGKFSVSMFETIEGPISVRIDNNGMIITEEVDNIFPYDVWKECMPTLWATPVFGYEYSSSKKKITLDENLNFGINNVYGVSFTDLYIEIHVDGKDIRKVDVGFDESKSDYSIELDKHLTDISSDDKVTIHLVGVDSLGYTHKLLVHVWMDGRWAAFEDIEDIYDKDGNPLTTNEPILEVY